MQHRNQHEHKSINYFSPNIIKCFILLHDGSSSIEETEAQNQFSQMQSAFGPQVCHFLKINTGEKLDNSDNNKRTPSFLAQYWLGFSHRFCSTELRRNISDASLGGGNNTEFNFQQNSPSLGSDGAAPPLKPPMEHPLALSEGPETPPLVMPNMARLSKAQ